MKFSSYLRNPFRWIAAAAILFGSIAFAGYFHIDLWSKSTTTPLYLTWQHNPSTTITVQWIAPPKSDSALVFYRKEGDVEWLQTKGSSQPLPQRNGELHVYAVELTNLTPNTVYAFCPFGTTSEQRFKTLPTSLHEPLRFVVGGDMYHETAPILRAANRSAAKTSPAFVIAGGDIAYASAQVGSDQDDYQRWIDFLVFWTEDMVTPEGLTIPIVPVIGNHDVNGRHNQPPENARFFYTLFKTPAPKGFHAYDFGDYLSFIALDSAHTHPIEGEQAHWLKQALNERQDRMHKFVGYHVPAYPSVRKFNGKNNILIRKEWVPSFETYGVHFAFEHHEHAFKRSHPVKLGKIDPDGVVYLGDGAWGTTPRVPHTPDELWYIAKSRSAQHFWTIDISSDKRVATAYDVPTGAIIDTYEQLVHEPAGTKPH